MTQESEQHIIDTLHHNIKLFKRARIIVASIVILTGIIVFSIAVSANYIYTAFLLSLAGMSFLGLFLVMTLIFYYLFDLDMPVLQGKYDVIMKRRNKQQTKQ